MRIITWRQVLTIILVSLGGGTAATMFMIVRFVQTYGFEHTFRGGWRMIELRLVTVVLFSSVVAIPSLITFLTVSLRISKVANAYGVVIIAYGRSIAYELKLTVDALPSDFLRNCEAFLRETFDVRELRKWEDEARLVATVGPFCGASIAHRLDVGVTTDAGGGPMIRIGTEMRRRFLFYPIVDVGAVAMMAYIASWVRGTPLSKTGVPASWRAVESSIDLYRQQQAFASR